MMHRSEDELTVDHPSSFSVDNYVEPPTLLEQAPYAASAMDRDKKYNREIHPTWEGRGGRTGTSIVDSFGSTAEVFSEVLADGEKRDGKSYPIKSASHSKIGREICFSVTNDKEYKVGDLPQTPTELTEDEEDSSSSFMFTTFYRVMDASNSSSMIGCNNLQLVYESAEPVCVDFWSSALGWAEIKNKAGNLVAVLKREAWDLFTRRHTK